MIPLPPLVEPAAPLTPDEFARYSRHVLLPEVGELGQRRLKNARILVIGAGGLGAPALQYLAAAGVGTIGVIDDDVVDETNLQRQVIHRTQDIGAHKVTSAVRAINDLNPLVQVVPHQYRLTDESAPDLFSEYDLVLDGTDNFPTRYLTSDAAAAVNVPVLWASVLGFDAQISMFWKSPPNGPGVTLRDVFPNPPAPGSVPSCSQAGVVGAMVGTIGAQMAAEAVKLIIGTGDSLLGRLLVFDQLRTIWATIPLQPSESPSASGQAQVSENATAHSTSRRADAVSNAPEVVYVDSVNPEHTLLDVREDDEVAEGMIPGAIHIPLAMALTELGRQRLDSEQPITVYCAVGPRAVQVAQHLMENGFSTRVLRGGYILWSQQNQHSPAKEGQ